MRSFTATELTRKTSDVLVAAAQGWIQIRCHNKARFVVLSVEKFENMLKNIDPQRAIRVEDMTREEADELAALLEAKLVDDELVARLEAELNNR